MTPAAPPPADRYQNLSELREVYDTLVDAATGKDGRPALDDPWDRVRTFIGKACRTGRILDEDSERFTAQRLVTYWVNVLSRANEAVPDETLLLDYDETVVVTLDEGKRPYVTPTEFETASADLIGWKRLIRECVGRLAKNRLVAVIGPAGSGRLTLLTAGVLPELRKNAIPGSEGWKPLLPPIVPGADPLAELVAAVAPAGSDVEAETKKLRGDPAHLGRLLDAGGPSVLVIDQFDLLFAAVRKRDDITPYVNAVLAVREAGTHRVMLTLRSDALPQVAAVDRLDKAVDDGRVFLMFTTKELRQSIEEPARRVGLRFDPGVVDRLLADVQGDPAVAPLLQFSLLQLWDAKSGNRVTREKYEELGGGRVALGKAAERVYAELDRDGLGKVAERVFTALVQTGLNGEVSRQTVARADLLDPADSQTISEVAGRMAEGLRLDNVLDRLAKARLVERKGDTVSLFHPALAEVWPRLVEWLAEQRDARRRRALLRAAAEKWGESFTDRGYDRTLLWGGAALDEAETHHDLNELEGKFVRESRRRARRIARWLFARNYVLPALALIALIAGVRINARYETKKQEALTAQAVESTKQLGIRLAFMSTVTGMMRADHDDPAGAVLWYAESRRQLKANESVLTDEGEKQALDRNLRLRLGLAWRGLPVVRHVLYRPYMADAVFTTDGNDKVDHRLVASVASADNAAAESKIVRVLALAAEDGRSPVHDKPVNAAADGQQLEHAQPVNAAGFNRAGDLLLTAGGERVKADEDTAPPKGHATLWARGTDGLWAKRGESKAADLPVEGRVVFARLSRDGRWAVVVVETWGGDRAARKPYLTHRAYLWSVTADGLTQPKPLDLPDGAVVVNQVVFRPVGGLVGVALTVNGTEGEARLWETRPDGESAQPVVLRHGGTTRLRPPVRHLGFSLDGRWLVTCAGQDNSLTGGTAPPGGDAAVWGVENLLRPARGDREPDAVLPHGAPVLYAAFNGLADRPSDLVVTCAENGTVVLWAVAGNRWVRSGKTLEHGSNVNAADFSPDGRYLVTGCRDRKARVWDVSTETLASPPLDHLGTVNAVRFGTDGRTVVTTNGGLASDAKEVTVAQVWNLVDNDTAWCVPTTGVLQFAGLSADGKHLVAVALDRGQSVTQVFETDPKRLDKPPAASAAPRAGGPGVTFAAVNAAGSRAVSLNGPDAVLWDTAADHAWPLLHEADRGGADTLPAWIRALLTAVPPAADKLVSVNHACFSPDDKLLVTVGGDKGKQNGGVQFWDPATGDRLDPGFASRTTADHPFLFAAFSPPDGASRWVVATGGSQTPPKKGSKDPWAVLWRVGLADGRPFGSPVELTGNHTEPVTFAAFSPDGRRVVTASTDNTACVWDLPKEGTGADAEFVLKLEGKHTADVVQVAFDKTGRFVATAGLDGLAIVWDVGTKSPLPVVLDHGAKLTTVAFSPDDPLVVTAGQDGKCRVWDIGFAAAPSRPRPPRLLATFGHPGAVISAIFADGGKRLRVVSRPAAVAPDRTRAVAPAGTFPPGGPDHLPRGDWPAAPERPGLWVVEWDLEVGDGDADRIGNQPRLIARRELNNQRELALFPVDDLKASAGAEPKVSAEQSRDERLRYYDRQARKGVAAGLWSVALWNLTEALKLDPRNGDLYARRADLRATARREAGTGDWLAAQADWLAILDDYKQAITLAEQDASSAPLYARRAVARLGAARFVGDDEPTASADAEQDYAYAFLELEYKNPRGAAEIGDAFLAFARVIRAADIREQSLRVAGRCYDKAIELGEKAKVKDMAAYYATRAEVRFTRLRDSKTPATDPEWTQLIDDCTKAIGTRPGGPETAALFDLRAFSRLRLPTSTACAATDFLQAARGYAARGRPDTDLVIGSLLAAVETGLPDKADQRAEALKEVVRVLAQADHNPRRYFSPQPAFLTSSPAPSPGILVLRERQVNSERYLKEASEDVRLRGDAEFQKNLAAVYRKVGSYPDMVRAIERAVAASGSRANDVMYELADAHAMVGRWAAAAGAFDWVAATAPERVTLDLLGRIAGAHARAGNWDRAERVYFQAGVWAVFKRDYDKASTLWVDRARAHTATADASPAAHDHREKAVYAYTQALDLRKDDLTALVGRALAYERMGDWPKMAEDYDQVVRLQPRATWYLRDRARARAELGKWRDAADDMEKYTQVSPWDSQAWYWLAVAQLAANDHDGYRRTCAAVEKQFRTSTLASEANRVAWILALAPRPDADLTVAFNLVNAALKVSPKSNSYLNTLGAALYRSKKYDDAVDKLTEAQKLHPPDGDGKPGEGSVNDQLFLAMSQYHRMKTDDARKLLARADERIAAAAKVPVTDKARPTVWIRAEWRMHRHEAERLVNPASEGKK